jgi:hypothetical protein
MNRESESREKGKKEREREREIERALLISNCSFCFVGLNQRV